MADKCKLTGRELESIFVKLSKPGLEKVLKDANLSDFSAGDFEFSNFTRDERKKFCKAVLAPVL